MLHEAAPSIGHVSVITNACAASLFALSNGVDALGLGESKRVVVAGVDILTESMFGLLDRVQMTPPDRVRPFDRERLGVLMGDGAAAVVLEPLDAARNRGAYIFGQIRSVGLSCDAHHETAPDPRGMERAIRIALEQADLDAERIGFVMAHGTGTALNDKAEFAALASVFESRTRALPLTAIKSMTGHTSGASGLIGLITALMAFSEKRLPPTISYEAFMLEDQLADIVTQTRELSGPQYALVNAFGFGGVNASVVVEECR
jgi:3-oxoacyl-[acyl-carrier-protein] synthase II